jgi:hypothetical protein
VLARMLQPPDTWVGFTDAYLAALDRTAGTEAPSRRIGRSRDQRTEALAAWHLLLLDHLAGTEAEDRLDRLTRHSALGGPDLRFLQAQLAHRRGDLDTAHSALCQCLAELPGHPDFLQLATEIGAPLPARGR